MKLLFDLIAIQPTLSYKFHGGGYYGEIIFFALLNRKIEFIGIYNGKNYINPKVLESGVKLYDINKTSLSDVINIENIDTIYSPLHRYWPVSVKRYIITWHGVRGLEVQYENIKLIFIKSYLKKAFVIIIDFFIRDILRKIIFLKEKANYDKIAYLDNIEYITVSEHSKYSIINFYPHLAKKEIPVFYSPFMEKNEIGQLPSGIVAKKYFLLTSSARYVKNNLRAVWAFDELFSQRIDISFNVVLTGVTNKKIYTKKLKNKDKFIFLEYIERETLNSLHANAYAYIFPSLNEGFGYPPLESMRYGVPVAASGTSSVPEICQDAVIYFDPYNVSEIKNRILQLMNDQIYKEYSVRAIERYKVVSERQNNDLEKCLDFILK